MSRGRRAVTMSPPEVTAFLREPVNPMSLATMNPDATVHLCAMWYGFLPDGTIGMITYARSQKARNLARDPRFSALVESGTAYTELRGVELVGTVELSDDRTTKEQILASTTERYPQPPYAPARDPQLDKRVALLLRIDRTVSWDHRKVAVGGAR